METCRTCAKCDFKDNTSWFDLFHTTRCEREIEAIRVECSNWRLQISQNDGLPQKICADCFSKFSTVWTFRQECQEAQMKLSHIFDRIETESMNDFEDMDVEALEAFERRLLQRQWDSEFGSQEAGSLEDDEEGDVKTATVAACSTMEPKSSTNMPPGNHPADGEEATLPLDDIIEEDFLEEDDDDDNPELNNNFNADLIPGIDYDDATTMVLESFEPLPTNTIYNNNKNYNSSTTTQPQPIMVAPTPPLAFECKYCYKPKNDNNGGMRFPSSAALAAHIDSTHTGVYPYTCPHDDCGARFADAASRTVHVKNDHVAKHYACFVCAKRYADRFNLRHHIEKFHGDTLYECGSCSKRFYSRKSLNYHMKWHQPELQLKCSQCDRVFISQRHLKCHEETHAGVRNSESCSLCGKSFIHLKTLRWHLYRHHGGEKPYKCGNCTEAFASYIEKRIHMLENHLENLTANERSDCVPCRKTFDHENALIAHIREEHLPRPKSATLLIADNKRVVRSKRQKRYSGIFQCDICTQRFNMKSALERHAAVHSSVGRPHMCPFESCAKRFKRAQDMNWHMKTHSNEKPNVCDICGKGFALKYVLNQHKRSHEVLEKNFKCSTCGRAYLFEKSLRVHERNHTGKTYYKCDLCGEAFVTHMKFKTHIKKIHDPNSEIARKQLLDSINSM